MAHLDLRADSARDNTTKPADRAAWTNALANFNAIHHEFNAHPYGRARRGDPDYGRLERENNELCSRDMEALEAALSISAPDVPALIEKLELFVAEYGHACDGVPFLELAIADLRRLTG